MSIAAALREKDSALVRLGRAEAQLKLRLGELLDTLFLRRGHHELGFSSFSAYVVERCRRSRSWGSETRGLARHLRERKLRKTRAAILSGRLGWSMAELLARHATAETEAELLERADHNTVRAMRLELGLGAQDDREDGGDSEAPSMRPTYRVSERELAMLEASRVLVELLNGARANDETFLTALLGEAETTLQTIEERIGAKKAHLAEHDASAFEAVARALREAMSARRTPTAEPKYAAPVIVEAAADRPIPATLRGLDDEICRGCAELARRNLEIGRLALALFSAQAWHHLGYDGPGQYARERIGLSLSSLEHRMTLARRVACRPELARALDGGEIGYEAALLLSRVVGTWPSAELAAAWIERARRRTFKHLREEVHAVVRALHWRGDASRFPPSEDDLDAVHDFERKVQNGELLRAHLESSGTLPQMSVTLAIPSRDGGARRPFTVKISADLYAHWRSVEAQLHAVAGREASVISFMCASLWETWLPFLQVWNDKWRAVYRRDRHQCTSPVCERRDVTPHHLHFQAHGGSDAEENMTSACAFCHLEGIHRGRLRAEGGASKITWMIGRDPIMVVEGREKIQRSTPARVSSG